MFNCEVNKLNIEDIKVKELYDMADKCNNYVYSKDSEDGLYYELDTPNGKLIILGEKLLRNIGVTLEDYESGLLPKLYSRIEESERRDKVEEFLKKLTELSIEHQIFIDGCGCCGSPYLLDLSTKDKPKVESNIVAHNLNFNKKQNGYDAETHTEAQG